MPGSYKCYGEKWSRKLLCMERGPYWEKHFLEDAWKSLREISMWISQKGEFKEQGT